VRDCLSKERRSWNMSRIRGKDTTPEKVVRSLLHRMSYRFRLHGKKLPGPPDIVLPKFKTVVFVHGCLWALAPGFGTRAVALQRQPSRNQDWRQGQNRLL